MEVNFTTESNNTDLVQGAEEYQNIWDNDGDKIAQTMEQLSGLSFGDQKINALVCDTKISSSGYGSSPMRLRAFEPKASNQIDYKKAILIHELGHRLLDTIKPLEILLKKKNIDEHRLLYLFLFDVWQKLYGEKFAKSRVEIEKKFSQRQKKCWAWTLSFNKEERNKKFREIVVK